ncbi:hypothetical protein QZM25_31995 [Burkholderia contaminans]|uniref:hypothetical protein n=1 Tax=Burkholderia contaminans TaxID=488447 RepID=UPI001CF21D4F|nr:hypothetical protein [Burkholderia contaminans]MCA7889680.1 hypothetical protein [Burkholderia contaminans]MDN7577238.1 hypothetical protein [Burkholderia contaminans]
MSKDHQLREEIRESVDEGLIVFVRFLADVILISALSLVIGASALLLGRVFDGVEQVTHDPLQAHVLFAFHLMMLALHVAAALWVGIRGLKRFVKRFS